MAMNPLAFITRPIKDLSNAVLMPFKAVFVVGLCWAINAVTFSGVWWVQWVALGMGIATVVAVARGARTLLVLLLAGWVGMKIYQRYGPAARSQFDAWVARTNPGAAQMLQAWGAAPAAPGHGDSATSGRPH
jgi:hypothetical protein